MIIGISGKLVQVFCSYILCNNVVTYIVERKYNFDNEWFFIFYLLVGCEAGDKRIDYSFIARWERLQKEKIIIMN